MSPYPQQTQGNFRSGGNPGGARPGNSAPPSVSIDVSQIRFGKGKDENIFADIAQSAAQAIAEDGKGRSGKLEKNKSTQLRKFYDELVMWHDKVFGHGVEDKAGKYKELAPFIKMMCAKVAYAQGRGHVSTGFEKLFSHVISKSITNPETLKDAKLFMEAFMGFYKAEEK